MTSPSPRPTSRATTTATHAASLALLVSLFPHTNPSFLSSCVAHHLSLARQSRGRSGSVGLSTEQVVARVSEKVLEDRETGGRETEGEEVKGWVVARVLGEEEGEGIIARSEEVRRAFRRDGERAGGRRMGTTRTTRTTRRVDETLARNLALIRLHALFPLEPIASLRSLVRTESHSFLSRGVEKLLEAAALARKKNDRPASRGRATFSFRDVWDALFPPSPPTRARGAKGKGVARDDGRSRSTDDSAAPVLLTPGDLFHSPAYDAALVSHFDALFPSLAASRPRRIRDVVELEGGTYEGMRGRLEELEIAEEERRASGSARRGWWMRLIGVQEVQEEDPGVARRMGGERVERRDAHPLLRADVEAFWRAREGKTELAPQATPSSSSTAGALRGLGDECQCCFAPISPNPADSVACSLTSPSPECDRHAFCNSCLAALVRTYTFGGAPLPDSLLEDGSIPCFAASAAPCPHRIPASSLSRALEPPLRSALDRRVLETTLDRLVADGAALARCPFCPYAVVRDAGPAARPLASVFVPAWVATFPPGASDVARTIVGLVCLAVLVLVGSLLALLLGGSAKLERTYEDLYPSTDSSTHASAPLTPLLPLKTHLLLAPHHTAPLVVSHLRTTVARILAVKLGRDTVFVCGAIARAGAGSTGSRWLARLEGVQELVWEDEEEREGEGERGAVEERRRTRLVEYLWPHAPDDDDDEDEAEGRWKPCGRLSCTVCAAPLNPSAPSLHRCASAAPSASTTDAPSEQARAEESLRLVVEKAMSDAVSWTCRRCGARGRKEVGVGACNKVTCRCGTAYCHLCHTPIPPSVGYSHFCQHPHDPRTGRCEQGCGKCGLWEEPDERKKVESARREAQLKWAHDHPDWAGKVNLSSASLKRVGPDLDVDSLTEQVWDVYDGAVETVARVLLP